MAFVLVSDLVVNEALRKKGGDKNHLLRLGDDEIHWWRQPL